MYDKETIDKIYGMFVDYHYCSKEREHYKGSFLTCYSKICDKHRLMLIELGWTYLARRENKNND